MAKVVAGNTVYDTKVLETKFEDQYKTYLDLARFVTIDTSLVGTVGDTVTVNVYKATEGTEELVVGQGNSKTITVSVDEEDYKIKLLQNKFAYNDEQAMKDNNLVPAGQEAQVTDMFNKAMELAMAEFNKATLTVTTQKFNFDAFVDAVAKFPNAEAMEKVEIFALVNGEDRAEIRKELKDDLKYITEFVKTGYIGTVNGVNLYTSNIVTKGTIIIATKEAVKYLAKTGTEVEYKRDPDTRYNEIFNRKYGVFAFANETRAVKLTKAGG